MNQAHAWLGPNRIRHIMVQGHNLLAKPPVQLSGMYCLPGEIPSSTCFVLPRPDLRTIPRLTLCLKCTGFKPS